MAAALLIVAIIYLPIVFLTDAWPTTVPSTAVIVSVLALALVCSALAFLLMFALVAEVGPVRMTMITYINPAVAVIAGAVLLAEPITVWKIVGFLLVISGSYLVQNRKGPDVEPVAELGPEAASCSLPEDGTSRV